MDLALKTNYGGYTIKTNETKPLQMPFENANIKYPHNVFHQIFIISYENIDNEYRMIYLLGYNIILLIRSLY